MMLEQGGGGIGALRQIGPSGSHQRGARTIECVGARGPVEALETPPGKATGDLGTPHYRAVAVTTDRFALARTSVSVPIGAG
jgi:hypothetical protein